MDEYKTKRAEATKWWVKYVLYNIFISCVTYPFIIFGPVALIAYHIFGCDFSGFNDKTSYAGAWVFSVGCLIGIPFVVHTHLIPWRATFNGFPDDTRWDGEFDGYWESGPFWGKDASWDTFTIERKQEQDETHRLWD